MKLTVTNPLIGTWKLISFELRLEDGSIKYPWGNSVAGQVIYAADGYMAGSLMKQDRPVFEEDDVMVGSAKEFEEAMKSYIGYAGPYSLHDNRVCHHASVSLFPNWTGTIIDRFFDVTGDKLTLSTPPVEFNGVQATAALVWEKLPPSASV